MQEFIGTKLFGVCMSRIVRAEVVVHDVETCPVANAANRTRSSVAGVVRATSGDTTVEEFSVVESPADADDESEWLADDGSMEEVFSAGDETVYRFEHAGLDDCICEAVEAHGAPVRETMFEDGDLVVAFHATVETVGDVVDDLSGLGADVSVQRLVTPEGGSDGDLVLVDRSELTARQLEVLRTAHRMGYFAPSGGANASDVAAEFDLAVSTVTQHLSAAQGKLLDAVLASASDDGRSH